jgi:FixJ family two-component response regulator
MWRKRGRLLESGGIRVVYIIDDDESVLNALELLMLAAGFGALTFSSAAAFLESVAPSSRDCLILDLRMPGMDGFDLLKALSDRGVTVPIIVLTALDDPENRERACQMGVDAFFRKPVDDQALIDMVRWLLEKSETRKK